MNAFEEFADCYWRRVRHLKAVEPWRAVDFRWTLFLDALDGGVPQGPHYPNPLDEENR